jgi:periplasmic protein TonB
VNVAAVQTKNLPSNSSGPTRGGPRDQRGARRRPLLRYGASLAVIALLFGGTVYYFFGGDDLPPPRQVRELTIVNVVPPPPPPPPPPQKPPEQKMIEQPKMAEPEIKEDKPLEKPKDEPVKDAKNDQPPGPLSLDAKATGPGDLFGLGGKPGGSPYGGGGGGSRWGWYTSIVTGQMEAALQSNPRTRNAVMELQVRIWADATGHVTRVVLTPSTGDADLDTVIRNQILGNLVLREPPPKDMPMPIVTKVTERRPT